MKIGILAVQGDFEAHEELGEAMPGIDVRQLEEKDLLATRGW